MRTVLSLCIATILAFGACNSSSQQKYQESESGLKYKVHTESEGKSVSDGDVIIAHKVTKTDYDSVISSTYEKKEPEKISVKEDNHMFDIFSKLNVGDSLTIKENVDSLIGESSIEDFPPFFKKTDYLIYEMKIKEITNAMEAEKMTREGRSPQVKEEVKEIKQYLEDKGLTAESTPSGLHYIVEKEGTGKQPTPDDFVKLHFEGYVMEGDEYASTREQGSPIEFQVKNMFPGLKEGVMNLKEGAKAKLLIPSPLAFGEEGNEKVPPNSIMIFDVEIVEVRSSDTAT